MGHIVRVPCVRVQDLGQTLKTLANGPLQVASYAAVLESSILLSDLNQGNVPSHWCCVMGNEANGISTQVRACCTYNIRIDMEQDVDSLSVPVATGILLHGLRERETRNNATK